MPSSRRAAGPKTSTGAIVTVAAIVAALALIPILVTTLGASGEASEGGGQPISAADSQHHSGNNASGAGQSNAAAGPVTELDKTFLVKVRQAGLWEIPAGELAQDRASQASVKRAGQHLIDGHSKLDQLVREDARILGVEIPDQATPEQQGWVNQLRNAKGDEFDRLFANLLRASHGKIFATIAEVRAGTQNDLIRRHARQANQTVLDHMEVLEDTGLVSAKTLQEVEAAVAPPK